MSGDKPSGSAVGAPKAPTEGERRSRLREALIEGCIANAGEDLAICREWDAADAETAGVEDER